MNVLIDTNVVLDVLLKREPFFEHSQLVLLAAEKRHIVGYVSASAITDIFYISQKDLGKKAAKESLKILLQTFKPATVTGSHIHQALDLDWDDFEDSVQYTVGKNFPVDYIITRNIDDYTSSYIPVLTPEQFIQVIAKDQELPRNEAMLAVLRRSAERHKNTPVNGSTEETLEMIRRARAGEMWGYEPTESE